MTIDFMKAIPIPLLDNTILYSTGADGYPAFSISLNASINKSVSTFVTRVTADFAVVATIRPETDVGGFLFAVVDPSSTIIEFGLKVSAAIGDEATAATNVSQIFLYYTDRRDEASQPIAQFLVPQLTHIWTKFGLKVKGDAVTLYLNCDVHSSVKTGGERAELTFEEGSMLYFAQAGPKFGGKFEV